MVVALVGAVAFTSCKSTKNIKSFSEKDSVAYALGNDLGRYLKNLDSTLNVDIVAQGIRDAIAGKEKIQMDSAYAFLNDYFMVRVPARNLKESQAYLEKVAKENKNIKTTPDGLLYEVVSVGDTAAKAKDDRDEVQVNYTGSLKSGDKFDSGDSVRFTLNQVVPGWQEGLKLIGKGGKINLWIPPHLGYGEQGRGKIKANDVLVFQVELLDVKPFVEEAAPATPVKK